MRKLLSLLMALVMTASLVTVSAAAKEFTDDDSIAYQEAVDVMLAVDVISGYENGTFKPQGSLTRGAAAKIICNMVLGPTTAGALVADAAPFADVPQNHTFAPYIAYVAGEGIVNGYADGSFRPAGTLTGYALMKMLLGALGYDPAMEGYTGENWSINVAKQGLSLDLTEGLEKDFEGHEMIDRQTAMLLAFNAMQTNMVRYGETSDISVGGVTVSTKTDAIDTGMSFMQMYFPKLEKKDMRDPMGRPSTRWMLDGTEIGVYAKQLESFSLDVVSAKTLYAQLGLSDTLPAANIEYYVDGVLDGDGYKNKDKGTNEYKGFTDISKKGTGSTGEQGVLTEIYWDHDAQKLTIVEINTYVGEIINVKTENGERKVTVAGYDFRGYSGDFATEDFDFGDVVIYTVSQADDEIQTMSLANTMTVTVTKVVSTGKFVADAKIWTNHRELALQNPKMINNDGAHPERPISVGNTVKLFLNAYNYVVWAEQQSSEVSNLGIVLDIAEDSDTYGGKTYWVKLLRLDGTTEELEFNNFTYGGWKANVLGADVAKFIPSTESEGNYQYYRSSTVADARNILVGNLVTSIRANSKGAYRLDLASVAKSGTVEIENGVAAVSVRGAERYTSRNTTFLVQTGTAKEPVYTAYKGYQNVPDLKGDDVSGLVYCPIGTTMADVVYVKDVQVSGGASEYIYIHGVGHSPKVTDTNGDVYPYPAIIDGKITAVNVNANMDGNQMYTELVYDKNGAVELDDSALYLYNTDSKEDEYAMKAVVTAKYKDDVIGLNNASYSVSDDVDVWCVTDNSALNKEDTISAISIKSVQDLAAVRAIMVDGEVAVLICYEDGVSKQMITDPAYDKDDTTKPSVGEVEGGYDVDSDVDTMDLLRIERVNNDWSKLNVVVEAPVALAVATSHKIEVEIYRGDLLVAKGEQSKRLRVSKGAEMVIPAVIQLASTTDSRALSGEFIVKAKLTYKNVPYDGSEKLTLAPDPNYAPPQVDTTVTYETEKYATPAGAVPAAGGLKLVDSVWRNDGGLQNAMVISVANPTGEVIPADTTYFSATLWDATTGKVVGGTKNDVARRTTEVGATGNYACIVYFDKAQDIGGLYKVKIDIRMDQDKDYNGEWYTVTAFVEAT